jgi:signal transduction histidine kinase
LFHIKKFATLLSRAETLEVIREIIVEECQSAISADAVCLYLLRPKGYYEMIAERGCTQRFKHEWYRLYPEKIPLLDHRKFREPLFVGSADEFKQHIPSADNLVDHSRRKKIAYVPLVVNDKAIGLFGFSYNTMPDFVDNQFIMTLANLSADALERARLFDLERQSRQDAEAANRAKTDFFTKMSHEIRAPISAIQGFADLCNKSDIFHSLQKNWIARILKNAQHLSGLIGNVLDISKIEADKVEVCRNIFSLSELIEDVKAVTEFKAQEHNINLKFDAQNSDVEIYSDPVHIRQILINLIGNAIKFTNSGGEIVVDLEYKNSILYIDVRDTGIGIAPHNQARIFEPFTQVEKSELSKSGNGLGLFISKRLAIALGGNLTLQESVLHKGSWFNVEIPCELAVPERKLDLNRDEIPLRGLNFLLVDDSEDNRDLVKYILSKNGANVDTAENGIIGIEKAKSSNYEVVIMDIQMPELDGNQAVSRLRAGGYSKPVVALTAEVLAHQREESLQRGFDEYLSKPINSDQLIGTLMRLARH